MTSSLRYWCARCRVVFKTAGPGYVECSTCGKGDQIRDYKEGGGIFFERKVFLSAAYQALSKNARMVLLAILDARKVNPTFKKSVKSGPRSERYVDLDKIKMPYNMLVSRYGIRRASIPAAIDDLLAKGFIEIKHAGGAAEYDQSVYGLIEDYLEWKPGMIFRRRQRDIKRGFQGRKLGVVAR
jgi:hypothetical protein